jgi:hypothetical protein
MPGSPLDPSLADIVNNLQVPRDSNPANTTQLNTTQLPQLLNNFVDLMSAFSTQNASTNGTVSTQLSSLLGSRDFSAVEREIQSRSLLSLLSDALSFVQQLRRDVTPGQLTARDTGEFLNHLLTTRAFSAVEREIQSRGLFSFLSKIVSQALPVIGQILRRDTTEDLLNYLGARDNVDNFIQLLNLTSREFNPNHEIQAGGSLGDVLKPNLGAFADEIKRQEDTDDRLAARDNVDDFIQFVNLISREFNPDHGIQARDIDSGDILINLLQARDSQATPEQLTAALQWLVSRSIDDLD